MKKEHQCWNFIMSSFARSYGVNRVMIEQKFHEIALQWCDDNNYVCNIHLDDLNKVDAYFRNIYDNWEN
jgi:hypothetical protein